MKLYFRYGTHVTANLASQYVPVYQYVMSVKNSGGLLNRFPIPSESLNWLCSEWFSFNVAYGFDLGASHTDDLNLLAKILEPEYYEK